MRCHYSKLPCKVNGVATLNPINHYRPRGYGNSFSPLFFCADFSPFIDAVNSFEGALNAIEANNAAISEITQQYLAGLSVLAHTDNIHAQAFNLRGCLTPVEEEEEEADGEDEEDEAPSDVAEGESGPSKKRKHK